MQEAWEISELLTIVGSVSASFIFIYSEMKAMKSEMKADFNDIRNARKAEIEQSKQDIMINISDVKQSFKNDLNTFRIDLNSHRKDLKEELILMRENHKIEIGDLKTEAKRDMKEMQTQIMNLGEKIAMLNGMLGYMREVIDKKDN